MPQFRLVRPWILGLALVSTGPSIQAQPRPKTLGGVPIRGNEFSTINVKAIQKELALTDDQKGRVNELCTEFQNALKPNLPTDSAGRPTFQGEGARPAMIEGAKRAQQFTTEKKPELPALLTAQQKSRLSQIILQDLGPTAVFHPETQAQLELTTEQQEKLTAIRAEYVKIESQPRAAPRGLDRKFSETERSRATLLEAQLTAGQGVLTESQREKLRSLKGEDFDVFTLHTFGPSGRSWQKTNN